MHPQLQAISNELEAASARLARLHTTVPAERWAQRKDPRRWSVVECVAHLNLSSAFMLPPLEAAVAEARTRPREPGPMQQGLFGWLLAKTVGPEFRGRMQTAPKMVPAGAPDPGVVVEEFGRWQERALALVRSADGLPLGRVWITSPINARIRYTAFAGLRILSRHQHRHLQQAERVWAPAD